MCCLIKFQHLKIQKETYENHKFKIQDPTSTNEFELLDGSYSVSDIQDYFKYVIKNHDTLLDPMAKSLTDNPQIRLYVKNIENRITFGSNSGYDLELLTHETMKLLRSTENKTAKN